MYGNDRAENDFILRRKENLRFCRADVAVFIHELREVNGENRNPDGR